MKKIIALVLATLTFVLALSLAGCGKKDEKTALDTVTFNEHKAETLLHTAEFKKLPASYGDDVCFDTYSGVMYQDETSNLGISRTVLFSKDGVTPRNIYTERHLETDAEKITFLANNFVER